ncbi:ATP-dependent DNA helicase [Pigmentiphaga litoralis]|uniref:DNA excision repair protein ERCC-2 n=1 Tax=Pigmentiphaga litoralis TaxID=516702 RepID=A0A7Y9LQ96_9BURK|nr:ATP-dependent DNA helicase [Pigmentiphaga litoralis]NYE26822.1 DNA excision repair protein ERCC-2 [Pigmentiphaga litoralis]NYE85768.1 DNA excision repair protein ERCC-2 [Pigmentiphaga litoralis]
MDYVVAVRALCEFTAKAGDLDVRFTPSPSAQEGVAGHTLVASRRPDHYESEITLTGSYQHLRVRGRADGYDPVTNQLEEVKTFRGHLDRMPANHRALHWAQAKVYGWLLCQDRGLDAIDVALVYFDIGTQEETVLVETHSADDLKAFFELQCERFIGWSEQEVMHREARDAACGALGFPYGDFRPGQRQLAEAVYRSASQGCAVMAQAPTGIGKTVGTLFPLLKACPSQGIDKVFFLTAKTSGRSMALDALDLIARSDDAPPLRVLELVARKKACEHPDKACHGEACPLAKGFYDRVADARADAVSIARLDRESLRDIALQHEVCPYYLSQDLARWADVIIGDYNYYYDSNAMLFGLTLANQWKVSVLVDEAHNLVDRGRKMYSAELSQAGLKDIRLYAPPTLKKPLEKLNRIWNEVNREQTETYTAYEAVPAKWLIALQQAVTAVGEELTERPAGVDEALQQFYFDALRFQRIADSFGAHSLFDITLIEPASARPKAPTSVMNLRNVVPASFLAPRFAAARSTALFSATLSPHHFYQETLGLPKATPWIDVASPFVAEQLSVQVVGNISTRYQHRDRSLDPIVTLMARQYRERPGNYLAFFSSFDYLQKVLALFQSRHPDIEVWAQSRGMDEAAQSGFLARFAPDSRGIGFAVLGGSFSEGVDLPGSRLIGAFIATLGLPQINDVNQQMRARVDALGKSGYDTIYLYPGMQKVVQAAGRVIRTQTDTGVVYLIDDRFARPEVRGLLPAWWQVQTQDHSPKEKTWT